MPNRESLHIKWDGVEWRYSNNDVDCIEMLISKIIMNYKATRF